MKINNSDFKWNGQLHNRKATEYIILHHRAGDGDVESIHRSHIMTNGWVGIGYNFYVRKDGTVWRGRPTQAIGAHCDGFNSISVGVCFEGNFETEREMSGAQLRAGRELVSHLKGLYPTAKLVCHRDLRATACPGKNFPLEEIKKGEVEVTGEEAVEIIQAKIGLEDETMDFLLCYKYGEELVLKIAEAVL